MKILKSCLAAACAMISVAAAAQGLTPLQPDTAVLVGKLPNGLTYIIRHNELPKGVAEFYIAQKVGAVLEEDNQDGLAHFLEHMAFNGTKNFPGKGIVNFLERVGVRFGENVNAFTSLDETVYNLSAVPTTDPAIVDSALLTLHDWSGFISLEGDEIDKERGVIREEWRTRASAFRRLYFKHMANTMPGTRYAVRDVIGDTAVINNFTYDALRAYYHKWYRPDLQGIVIVGDVDPKTVEKRIAQMWADIPAPVNPAKRVYEDVALNDKPVFSILFDKENTRTTAQIQFRYKPQPDSIRNTVEYAARDIIADLATSIFNTRMADLSEQGAPFSYAMMGDMQYVPTLNMLVAVAASQNGKTAEAFDLLLDEMERLRRFGVTEGELQRAVDNLIKEHDDEYENRNKVQSADYVRQYYGAFLNNNVITSTAFDRDLVHLIAPNITVQAVNAYIASAMSAQPVFQISAVEGDSGVKSPEEYEALYKALATKDLKPYQDKAVDTKLVDKEPKPGKVKKWAEDKVYGSRIATLSNGVRVFLLPTTYEDNNIILSGIARGGFSTLTPEYATSAAFAATVTSQMGLGKFSNSDLRKALTGKTASVSADIDLYKETISGASSKQDFETMLQMAYLTFTTLRVDTVAYQATYDKYVSYLANASKSPDNIFRKRYFNLLKCGNPYVIGLTSPEDLDGLELDKVIKAKEALLSSARGFDFVIVGSFDTDSIMPAVCKWLGALPTGKKATNWVPRNDYKPQADTTLVFTTPMTTEKVSFLRNYTHKHKYNRREQIALTALKRCLDMRYLESVREDQGGTYGVSVIGSLSKEPTEQYQLIVVFDTDPKAFDRLEPIIDQEIKNIAENGPRPDDLDKVKKNLVKARTEALQTNAQWVGMLEELAFRGTDDSNYQQLVEAITPADVQAWAKLILSEAHRATIIMKPAEK